MTKLYLSGPMTGLPKFNFDEFEKYDKKFTMLGYEIVNPHKLEIFNTKEWKSKARTWEEFMEVDIAELFKCEVVAVLPGWENSRGALIEIFLAKVFKKKIICAEKNKEFIDKFSLVIQDNEYKDS